MHDHFDAFASHPGTSRPLFSPLEFSRHDNELLSRVVTHWYLEAPQTLEEWNALRHRPDLLDEKGRSRAERLELTKELSRRITGMIRDQFPRMDPQPLRDFANPPPGLSQAQRGHLLQNAHDFVYEVKMATFLRSRRADRLGPASIRALDHVEALQEAVGPTASQERRRGQALRPDEKRVYKQINKIAKRLKLTPRMSGNYAKVAVAAGVNVGTVIKALKWGRKRRPI